VSLFKLATPGKWVDTAAKLDAAAVDALAFVGKVGAFRYVPLPSSPIDSQITAPELELLTATLEVGLVQRVRGPGGWRPGAYSGSTDAAWAAKAAKLAGFPEGGHIFQDLEDIAPDVAAIQVVTYCLAWGAAMLDAGYRAGLYVGFDVPLTAGDLYALPSHDCYWSAPGPRSVARRGFAIKQGASVTIGGVNYDLDVVSPDLLGGLPMVAATLPTS